MSKSRFINAMERLKKSYCIDNDANIGYWYTNTNQWFAIKLHK